MDRDETPAGQADELLRHQRGILFFPPISLLVEALYGPSALPGAFEDFREGNSHLPTGKSMAAWFLGPQTSFPTRPSSVSKLEAMNIALLKKFPGMANLPAAPVIWQPYHEWTGFLTTVRERYPLTSAHWQRQVDAEYDLVCHVIPPKPSESEIFQVMAACDVGVEIGLPSARARWAGLEEGEWGNDSFIQAKTGDNFAVLIRVAAWCIAEDSLQDWDDLEGTNLDQQVLIDAMLPSFCQQTTEWSVPLHGPLALLASLSQKKKEDSISTHLGTLWAAEIQSDPATQQRLIRYWLEADPGKPNQSSIKALINAVAKRIPADLPFWKNPVRLHLYFRTIHIIHSFRAMLSQHGVPAEQLTEILGLYAIEYRRARTAMGKPMSP